MEEIASLLPVGFVFHDSETLNCGVLGYCIM
jgi:hypothetical protein